MNTNLPIIKEVTAEEYWDMMGAVPTQDSYRGAFLVGEATDHNSNGEAIYRMYNMQDDVYSLVGEVTQAQFDDLRDADIAREKPTNDLIKRLRDLDNVDGLAMWSVRDYNFIAVGVNGKCMHVSMPLGNNYNHSYSVNAKIKPNTLTGSGIAMYDCDISSKDDPQEIIDDIVNIARDFNPRVPHFFSSKDIAATQFISLDGYLDVHGHRDDYTLI